MDFSAVAGWAYFATGVLAVGFGLLQCRLTGLCLTARKPRYGLIALKLCLWAAAMTALALLSLPLLVVFTAIGTLAMLAGMARLYQKQRKEGERNA